jgi:hypothetical protein
MHDKTTNNPTIIHEFVCVFHMTRVENKKDSTPFSRLEKFGNKFGITTSFVAVAIVGHGRKKKHVKNI